MATITGTSGNDTITPTLVTPGVTGGTPSNAADTINGGAGNDLLAGGGGNDTLDGGTGTDTADFSANATGVTATIDGAGNGTATSVSSGNDTLLGIERLRGSDFADSLTATAAPVGTTARLYGRGGNDTLTGAPGGSFAIMADYFGTGAASVTVNLGTLTANDGLGGTDTLLNMRSVGGTAGADTLIGSGANDRISGRGGNDTLDGGAGTGDQVDYGEATAGVVVNLASGTASDGEGGTDTISNFETVYGSNFADTLTGNAGANEFAGGRGNDTINGGDGADRVDYNFRILTTSQGVTVNLATGVATDFNGDTDTLSGIERVTGTDFADSIIGDDSGNRFNGRGGNDVLDGGLGGDFVEYGNATSGVVVNLTTGTASDGQGGTDTLISIENVIGGGLNDVLTGVAQDKTWSILRGGRGNDTLNGIDGQLVAAGFEDQSQGMVVNLASGTVTDSVLGTDTLVNIRGAFMFGAFDDTITGTAFNDVLAPAAGNDTVDGGAGTDTVAYGGSETNTLVVNLATGTAQDGDGGTDTLTSIENVAAGYSNDTITGSAGDNVINPSSGTDTVDAGDGIDTLDYALGFSNRSIRFTRNEAGDAAAVLGMTINLAAGTATDFGGFIDSVLNFENAVGNSGNDVILGTSGANNLSGREGDDRLQGGQGDDTLSGGSGSDTAVFAGPRARYTITRDAVTGALTVADGEAGGDGTDTLAGDFEVLAFSDVSLDASTLAPLATPGTPGDDNTTGTAGPDTLAGLAGNDTLSAGDGDDSLDGGEGDDILDGGSGRDVAVFNADPSTLRIREAPGGVLVVDGGALGTDRLTNIEAIQTTDGVVELGADLSGLFRTSVGGDNFLMLGTAYVGPVAGLQRQLFGSGANEVYGGTAGNDFMNLFAGDDAANAGAGDDVVDGGLGSNFMSGGAGRDVFFSDGRAGGVTWTTITDWEVGEQLSVWGWQQGVSRLSWAESDGVGDYKGVTMRGDLNGDGEAETIVTWTGKTQADLPVPFEYDGLLWFVG